MWLNSCIVRCSKIYHFAYYNVNLNITLNKPVVLAEALHYRTRDLTLYFKPLPSYTISLGEKKFYRLSLSLSIVSIVMINVSSSETSRFLIYVS